MEETRIDLQGGKYTVLHTCGADFRALRSGEEWRSLVGDGLVMAMANEIEDMQSELSVRNSRIAELELAVKVATNEKEVAEINAEHWLNNLKKTQEVSREQRNQLRAELAAAKETIALYEVTAENCDLLRAELAAIKGQEPVAADVFQFLTAVMDAAGLVRHGRQSKELSDYLGKECARLRCSLASQAPSAVVMPAVPDGYKLVPIEPTAAQCFTAAFNLCNEFGDEFVRDNKQFALAAYRSLVAASPAAKGVKS